MMLFQKNLSSLNISSSHHLLRFSTSKTQNPSPKPPFMVEYLISSCGFSPDKAMAASKSLTHIKSPSKPDSVLHFLRQCGLSNTHIRKSVSMHPRLLCANVERTLKPKFRALQGMGFSESELIQLVSENPASLKLRDLKPKIEFWKSLLVTNETVLKIFRRDSYLLCASLSKRILPNITILRECGFLDNRIAKMIVHIPRFIGRDPNWILAMVRRAEELGVPRSSRMFCLVLQSVFCISKATLDSKFKLLKSLGWSEAEIMAAFRKCPGLFRLSEKNISDTMDFLVKESGCELSFVVCRPVLLLHSLEGRLIPRHFVLRVLKREELKGCGLLTAVSLTEKKFVEKFVLPYKEKVPGLYESYVAACAGHTGEDLKQIKK